MKSSKTVFPVRLQKEMDRIGLSRSSIAERIGISKSTITRYLDGSIGVNAYPLSKLSMLFGCSADYLIGLTSERRPYGELEDEEPHKHQGKNATLHELIHHIKEESQNLSQKQLEQIYSFVEFQIEKSRKSSSE